RRDAGTHSTARCWRGGGVSDMRPIAQTPIQSACDRAIREPMRMAARRSHRSRRLRLPLFGRRRVAQPRDLEDLLLVECIALEQRGDERVELLAMRSEQPFRFGVALLDDPLHLGVDSSGGLLAERLFSAEAARPAEIGVSL